MAYLIKLPRLQTLIDMYNIREKIEVPSLFMLCIKVINPSKIIACNTLPNDIKEAYRNDGYMIVCAWVHSQTEIFLYPIINYHHSIINDYSISTKAKKDIDQFFKMIYHNNQIIILGTHTKCMICDKIKPCAPVNVSKYIPNTSFKCYVMICHGGECINIRYELMAGRELS